MRKPKRDTDTRRGKWEWIKTWLYCAMCGKQDMWQESDCGDDYYHESSAICHSCGYHMCCVQKFDE